MEHTYFITENDIKAILQAPPRLLERVVKPLASLVACALIAGVGFYLFVPQPSISVASNVVTTASPVIPTATPSAASLAVPDPTPVPTPTPLPVTIPESTMVINDLGISAPITWRVPLEQNAMNTALTQGVIHIDGTALPGEQGVVAIAGHSSNYPWIKSDYNNIFAGLPKTKLGEIIQINYQNAMYQYQVTRTYEVGATDLSVLSASNFNGLHLITCVPVGTSLRRLIVEAVQIAPSPTNNTAFTPANFTGQLPSGQ